MAIAPKREKSGKNICALLFLELILCAGLFLPLQTLCTEGLEKSGVVEELCIIFMEFFGNSDYAYLFFKSFVGIGVILTLLCLVSSMRYIGKHGNILEADDDGITDRASEWKLGLVPWDDIYDIELKNQACLGVQRHIIEITIKDGQKYLPRCKERHKLQKPKLTGAGMLEAHIILRDMDADSVQIAVLLRGLLSEHRKTLAKFEYSQRT